MKNGFEKLADISIRLAQRCISLLEKIFKLISKLAKKVIPGWGQLVSVFEWIGSGGSEIPYYSDAKRIADLIKSVINIFGNIKDLVAAIKKYLNYASEMKDAVLKIPETGDIYDAVQVNRDVSQKSDDMEEQRSKIEDNSGKVKGELSNIEKRLNPGNDD